jgi:Calcineurin-like phosphoesterase
MQREVATVTVRWMIALGALLGVSCASRADHNASGTTTESGSGGGATTSTTTTTTGSVTGLTGGMLDTLSFAVVGDTRPPNEDDTAGYPTAVITKVWQDITALSPRPPFAVTTGDYMFANPSGNQQAAQVALYLGARAAYPGVTFAAMGNHECTGATASNCGTGNTDGITTNYSTFLSQMLMPLGVTLPYYTVNIASTTPGAWTAKIVFIAGNAWDTTQSTWLDGELAKPTTYTFVVRHESADTTGVTGVTDSEPIIAKYPYTLKIVGHTHTYEYRQSTREVIVGNGGAPLSGSVNYGYVIAAQRSDGAIVFSSYDYMSNAVVESFVVKADGTPTN